MNEDENYNLRDRKEIELKKSKYANIPKAMRYETESIEVLKSKLWDFLTTKYKFIFSLIYIYIYIYIYI